MVLPHREAGDAGRRDAGWGGRLLDGGRREVGGLGLLRIRFQYILLGLLDGLLLDSTFRGTNGAPGVNLGIRPKPEVFRVPETANPWI